ncbi:MAG: PAS domain-containing sensor histidine kinase, partial [Acidimicrobiia bacterium]|nr:PAS domain-containing sensor histidine kinase [Acidimicrobiia bacterium]
AVAHRQTSRLTPEVVRSVVVGVGAGSLMITLFLAAGSVDQPLMYMALAIMMIAATVIGGRNLMVVVAAVTVIMANLTIAGYGPFTTGAGATDVASMQLFAAVVMLSSGAVARIHRRSKTLADQLGKVFDAARSPVLVVSKSGQIELENRAAIEVFGGHVAGSSLAAVFGADTVSELLEAEEPIEVKAAIGGVDHTFDVRSGRFDSEDGPAYVLIARDISESIEASRRIRQLSAIVEASPNFIGFATAEGLISYLSPGARAMTGFGDGPASDVEVGGLSPEWAAEQLRTVAIPAAREHGVWQGDSAYLGPEGEEIPVAQTVIAHRSESGEIEMYSTIAMDLSDRVRAERARSELVANIVHDLKNPLVAISGAGEMLDDDVEAGLGIDAQLVQIVRAGALQLRELVEDLIETERVRRLRSTPVEVVDIAGLARQVASLHLIRAGQQGVDLLIRGVPSPVLGHRSELHRLVENLVTNAIKYSPEGGAVIVEVGLADDRVVLSVTDNGIGIAPADLDFMFTRYHRAQTARTAGIGGTGLGLAICKEIAAHHGGSIEVDSRVGVGSTFTVALPLAEDLTLAGDRASAGA